MRSLAVLLTATSIALVGATAAQADTGWVKYREGSKVLLKWHSSVARPADSLHDARVWALYYRARTDAIRFIRTRHRNWLTARARAHALLRQAEASIAAAQAAIAPSGGFWACVANAEEGGRNDPNHGYFGFMGPPSAFGSSGTWLSLSFSQQVAIAESVLAASGPGAWGPLTRAKCGF